MLGKVFYEILGILVLHLLLLFVSGLATYVIVMSLLIVVAPVILKVTILLSVLVAVVVIIVLVYYAVTGLRPKSLADRFINVALCAPAVALGVLGVLYFIERITPMLVYYNPSDPIDAVVKLKNDPYDINMWIINAMFSGFFALFPAIIALYSLFVPPRKEQT